MKVIEITEEKCQKMADLTEEMLRIGGKLMSCVEQLREGKEVNYRRNSMRDYDARYDRSDYRDEDKDWSREDWRVGGRYR